MSHFSLLLAVAPGALGAGIPLYAWTKGRMAGEIPSQSESEAMGLTYPPWHDEVIHWLALQLFALVGIFMAGLIARVCFKQSLRLACSAGLLVWLAIIVIGLRQYGWALAD
jgi:hypothetical protein